ncbi:MAG TPA: hypothetical protein VIG94_11720 [Faecalibacter sp.]|uniref:hypothetical protein n=1 Tax=Faecalibacter sp. LW9 TaxID=3103144 RepID=UPI002AFF6338|nr:hypothetical protein [Faecalibacter sp. LW9]
MLKSIIDNLSTCEKPLMRVIFRNNTTRIVAIGLKKGMKLVDHRLPVITKMILIKGQVIIDSKIEIVTLTEYQQYEIPAKVIHQVKVEEDALALLFLDFSQ